MQYGILPLSSSSRNESWKACFFFFENLFFPLIFLLGYIYGTGGIHCDNSGYAYVYLG
jgi:hypothetical protein